MSDRSGPRAHAEYTCMYCGEPLRFGQNGVKAWRVGDKFVCNEFCADGISPANSDSKWQSANAYRWINPTD
jgi:hypothetical protein